jgi:competence protein ComEC
LESRRSWTPVQIVTRSDVLSRSAALGLARAVSFATGLALERLGWGAILAALPPILAVVLILEGRGRASGEAARGWTRGPGIRAVGWRRAGAAALSIACGWAVGQAHGLADPLPAALQEWQARGFVQWVSPVGLRGRIADAFDLPDRRAALILVADRIRLPGEARWSTLRRRLTMRLTVPLPNQADVVPWAPGVSLEVTARIGPPRSFRNPGAFDIAAFHRSHGIDLLGSVKSPLLVRGSTARNVRPGTLFATARGCIVRRLRLAAGCDGESTAAFLAALLLGERDEMPAPLREALQRAGAFHIVALSGLNVALAMLVFQVMARPLARHPGRRRACLAVAIVVYWGLARDSGSMSRAALMALLLLAGGICGRRLAPAGALAVAGCLLLAVRPSFIADAGFQLSFLATLALLFAARPGPPAASARRWPLAGWIDTSLRASAAALLATAPLGARLFGRLTPAALAANLFAVPLTGVLLILAGCVVALQPLWPTAATGLCDVAARVIDWLGWGCAFVAAPPFLSFFVLPPPGWAVAWIAAALGAGALARKPGRRRAGLGAALAALVVIAAAGRAVRPTGTLEIIPLDVGQGDAVVVRFPNGVSMLVDAGGLGRGDFDVGARVVAPALRALGLLRLDLLAITHAHRDHLGGAAAIIEQFEPGAVWLGRMPAGEAAIEALARQAAERRIPVVLPRRGARLHLGGARLEVLNPGDRPGPSGAARNDDSLVLRLSVGRSSALLTGDIEAPIEAELAAGPLDLRAGLLKVAHHGSRSSSTAAFLRRVQPSLAMISVGASNPWGHPDLEVLVRLRAAGATIFETATDGAVRFATDGVDGWSAKPLCGRETGEGGEAPMTAGARSP